MENKKLILIVDDEPDFREMMRFFLENCNFRVIVASDGQEGLEKAQLKPDLILLDLNMPKLDGHQVCRTIKEDVSIRHIPIIILTAYKESLDKIEALNIGAVDYIGKDISLEEILAKVKAILRQTSMQPDTQVLEEKNNKLCELRQIIESENIQIVFQPIMDLIKNRPIGYEALSRGPKGSSLESPAELFIFANEANMFVELDTICRNLSVIKADFIKNDQILFLNTNPNIIDSDHFKALSFLKGTSLDLSQICIEITERTFITNFMRLSAQLHEFRKRGIKVAIDDVGAGYSSLKAIAELKPDFIKVDIDLVRTIDSVEMKKNLVMVLVDLGQKLNSQLIAEGIETAEECRTIMSLGVKYGQGFLFGRPSKRGK